MLQYVPLKLGEKAEITTCETIDLKWKQGALQVDLKLQTNEVIHVSFAKAEIVRLSDIFGSPQTSLDADHTNTLANQLACEVLDSPFLKMHEDRLKALVGAFKHYRFVSFQHHLDIIASMAPRFDLASTN